MFEVDCLCSNVDKINNKNIKALCVMFW